MKLLRNINPRRLLVLSLDALAIPASYGLAFVLRFELPVPGRYWSVCLATVPIVLLLRLLVFWWAGLYSGIWRYASIVDLRNILKGILVSSSLIAGTILFIEQGQFPRSVFFIDGMLLTLLIGLLRFGIRYSKPIVEWRRASAGGARVLIVGAGDTGETYARHLMRETDSGYFVVGFIDQDRRKHRLHIRGIPVLGGPEELPFWIDAKEVDEVIVAVPSAKGETLLALLQKIRTSVRKDVTVKTIPGITELIKTGSALGKHAPRAIELADLLPREEARLDHDAIRGCLKGRRVMITGAGGTIGSELFRQVLRFEPSRLVLLDINGTALLYREAEWSRLGSPMLADFVVANVQDRALLEGVFERHRPEVIFHAAAHKHVSLMESNLVEAVKTNTLATRMLAELAGAHGASHFVFVSTDKAVQPRSVMGATKRAAERLIQRTAQTSGTKFIIVRFGNVLGSSGSVVPLFQEQIARGGPVVVTHPEVSRYFMTIDEAAQLIIQAAAMGRGGEIFVLNMGNRVRIVDLARHLIVLSGYEPHKDIPIEFCGLRPGEKLTEELSAPGESIHPSSHPAISVVRGAAHKEPMSSILMRLQHKAEQADPAALMKVLQEMVPTYVVKAEDKMEVVQHA